MTTRDLILPKLLVAFAVGLIPSSVQSNPEPDVDPTGNAGAYKTTVETGGGYNPHNGNGTRSITDLRVPGAPGVYGLDFTRHWNSTDESFIPGFLGPRPFGAGGWTHSWNWTASRDIDTMYCDGEGQPCSGGYYVTYTHVIKIEYPDGRTGRFTFSRTNQTPQGVDPDPQTPEPYPSILGGPTTVHDHLENMAQDGSQFWLYRADGGAVFFEAIGEDIYGATYRATKVVDPHGLATILSYTEARLNRVAGPDGRSLFLEWGWFGETSAYVIRKVGWGQTPGSYLQTVDYGYTLYSINAYQWYALTSVNYVGELVNGQPVVATYHYTPWNNWLQAQTATMPQGAGPLLTVADDPHFDGAMTRIKYVYRGGPGGEAVCPSTNPVPAPGNTGPSVHMAPFPVEKELNPDTLQVVSQLSIPCNGTSQTGTRIEYRGAGGMRVFYYGPAAGLEPGTQWEEIPNGPDNWIPPEANPNGGHGYNYGYEITSVTDFADNPANAPADFHHNASTKPWRTFDNRGTLTQFNYQLNNGRIKEVWHRDVDNTKRTYNWDTPTPGSSARDVIHLPNHYNHWLFGQTDERNKTTTYTRDHLRRVIRISYYDGFAEGAPVATEEFTYNQFNQVTSHKLPSLAVQHYEYTGSFLSKKWNSVDGIDEATIYSPDGFGRVGLVQNARARASGASYSAIIAYNARHQAYIVKYPSTGGGLDPTVRYEYDKHGNCTAITNELGFRSTFTYDSYRRCTNYTEPVNAPACAASTGINNRTWTWVYDRVTSNNTHKDPSTHTSDNWRVQVEPAYNAAGERRGTIRNYDYNDRLIFEFVGAIVSTSGGWNYDQGALHQYEYDENGNKTKYTDPENRVTSYEYDKRDRLITITETPRANRPNPITRNEYDATGNKTKVIFPNTYTQEWLLYDPFGQPLQFKDERGNFTDFTYKWGPMKKPDRVTTYRDRDNNAGTEPQPTTFYHDGMGRPTRVAFPDGSDEISAYKCDQLFEWKNRKSKWKTISQYDARGRELTDVWSDGSPGVTRTWDDANRLLAIANRFSAIDYSYDQSGQVLAEGSAITGGIGNATLPRKEVSYCRYPSGEISRVTYPNGFYLTRTYTVRSQLQSVDWNGGGVGYDYRPDGKVNTQNYGSAVQTGYEYDGRGSIQSIAHKHGSAVLSERAYHRDDRDRIVAWQKSSNQQSNWLENGRGDRYAYDEEGQVQAASYQAVNPVSGPTSALRADVFTYDELGNRMGSNNHVASRGYWMTFARRDNKLNQYLNWMPYSAIYYDDNFPVYGTSPNNGTVMADGGITASFNALKQPVAIGTAAFGNNCLWFGHDPLGRCVKRWMGSGNGTPVSSNASTYFYYDGWNLVQEGNSPNNPTRLYVHGNRVDEIVAQIALGNNWLTYFQYDASGNCILQTDTSGNIVEQYEYDAFGMPYVYDVWGNPQTLNGQPASPSGNRFLFTGREWLSDLRIYDFRNRVYQPELGRFLQPDPKGFGAGDYNLYRYCHNDPINNSDPSGLYVVYSGKWNDADAENFKKIFAEQWNSPEGRQQWEARYNSELPSIVSPYRDAPPAANGGASNFVIADTKPLSGANPLTPFGQTPKTQPDKRLSNGEAKALERGGEHPEDLKPKDQGSRYDLFKDAQGNIKVKPKDGSGPGEPTGLNINDFRKFLP